MNHPDDPPNDSDLLAHGSQHLGIPGLLRADDRRRWEAGFSKAALRGILSDCGPSERVDGSSTGRSNSGQDRKNPGNRVPGSSRRRQLASGPGPGPQWHPRGADPGLRGARHRPPRCPGRSKRRLGTPLCSSTRGSRVSRGWVGVAVGRAGSAFARLRIGFRPEFLVSTFRGDRYCSFMARLLLHAKISIRLNSFLCFSPR